MASAGEEESDVVLSDVEADDEPVPVVIDEVSVARFKELLVELDREKQARLIAENLKSDLQVSFNRLKSLAHEAIKKRDESNRLREEASRTVERLMDELAESNRSRKEILKQRDEIAEQYDESVKAKDSLRLEIETATQLLLSGIEKISLKANHIKNLSSSGLPKPHEYTGLPAISYGVIIRTNEILEELLTQIDSISNSKNEGREHLELRNYEITTEVSQLQATIKQLREEVSEKDGKLSVIETEFSDKLSLTENEALGLKKLVEEYDDKLRRLETTMESQRPLLMEQLNLVSIVHNQLCSVIKVVDMNESDQLEFSEVLFLPQETGLEENIRAFLSGMECIHELSRIVVRKTRDLVEKNNQEVNRLKEAVTQMVKEKEQVGVLLRIALSKRLTSDPPSKANKPCQVSASGLKDTEIDFESANPLTDKILYSFPGEDGVHKAIDDGIYSLAGALENIFKESQVEISELQHSINELRTESSVLKKHMEAQVKELDEKKLRIEELEQKERVANENVEGLMMDVGAAEEEITRWKVAAEAEAAAGRAVELDYLSQISALKQEMEEAKQTIIELQKKLKYKEETAAAAIAARDAAEKSLMLVDMRASRLRDRLEELTHQLEDDMHRSRTRPRYVCWPWEWLGLNFVGLTRTEPSQQQRSNEMELSEPFL